MPFYERDNIVIHHGDSLSVMPTLPSCSVDFILTDPPYLVNYRGRWDGEKTTIVGDDDVSWVAPAYREMHRLLKDDGFIVTFYGWPHSDVFVGTFKQLGFRIVSHLAFVKNVWGLGRFTRGQHETAFLLAKGRPEAPNPAGSDVIEWMREKDAAHPNQKPVSALYPLIESFAPRGGVVFDPFMGSGSTLRAAKDTGRCGVGIEIEERWCRFAVERLRQEVLFAI